jgi:hypothetical protein
MAGSQEREENGAKIWDSLSNCFDKRPIVPSFSTTLRRAAFSSYFCFANFEVILAQYTGISEMIGNESEHAKKQATNDMVKGNVCSTHPQGPPTTWCCSRAAASSFRRPLGADCDLGELAARRR